MSCDQSYGDHIFDSMFVPESVVGVQLFLDAWFGGNAAVRGFANGKYAGGERDDDQLNPAGLHKFVVSPVTEFGYFAPCTP